MTTTTPPTTEAWLEQVAPSEFRASVGKLTKTIEATLPALFDTYTEVRAVLDQADAHLARLEGVGELPASLREGLRDALGVRHLRDLLWVARDILGWAAGDESEPTLRAVEPETLGDLARRAHFDPDGPIAQLLDRFDVPIPHDFIDHHDRG